MKADVLKIEKASDIALAKQMGYTIYLPYQKKVLRLKKEKEKKWKNLFKI